MPDWTDHCPIDDEEWPVRRQAWHAGWIYRTEHGPGLSNEEVKTVARRMLDEYGPSMLPIWFLGHGAAGRVQRSEQSRS